MLCGTTPWHLSAESQALALLRAVARMPGVGPRTITARPKMIDLIQRWPDLVDAVCRTTGADIKLVCGPAINGYGQGHVAPA